MTTRNPNHPKLNSTIIIEPLRTLEDVQRVCDVLRDNPRNFAMFKLGVNTNLRACDLLALRSSDINWDNGEIILREQKTGKRRHIALAPGVLSCLEAIRPERDALLFPSQQTGGMMCVPALNSLVKKWCFKAGIKGRFGAHTLRKTFATIRYKVFGEDLALISRELNHASLNTTYRYLGIMPEDVRKLYMREI